MSAYTRFVSLSKIFLLLLVLVVMAVVFWTASGKSSDKRRLVFSGIKRGEDSKPVMYNPHYQGVDVHNQPYTVIAKTAVQKTADIMELETVNADMLQANGRWMALNADHGELNMQTKQLELQGHVDLFIDGGYEFRTDHAHVDIQTGTANGDSEIQGQGAPGTLIANSFTANSKLHEAHFNGSVRVKLYH